MGSTVPTIPSLRRKRGACGGVEGRTDAQPCTPASRVAACACFRGFSSVRCVPFALCSFRRSHRLVRDPSLDPADPSSAHMARSTGSDRKDIPRRTANPTRCRRGIRPLGSPVPLPGRIKSNFAPELFPRLPHPHGVNLVFAPPPSLPLVNSKFRLRSSPLVPPSIFA